MQVEVFGESQRVMHDQRKGESERRRAGKRIGRLIEAGWRRISGDDEERDRERMR